MKPFLMSLPVVLLTVGLTVGSLTAAPLQPEHLPRDAQWVLHCNYEALSESELMEAAREQWPAMAEAVQEYMEEKYGVEPPEDLRGLTLFSDTYEEHSGAAILHADFDRDQVIARIKASERNVQTFEIRGHRAYTWQIHGMRGEVQDRGRPVEDRGQPAEKSAKGYTSGDRPKTITTVLLDSERIVCAPTRERAEAVVALLEGDAPSLEGVDSPLVANVPKHAFFYGAAVNLKNITRHEGYFPLLRQHDKVVWTFGENEDGRLFEHVTMVARDAETAANMQLAVEGFVSMVQVLTAEKQRLGGLLDQIDFQRDGATVEIRWEAETDEVLGALAEIRDALVNWNWERQPTRLRETRETSPGTEGRPNNRPQNR